VSDFDRDGRLDLAVTTFNPSGVRVLLGNGDGTFQAPLSHDAESLSSSMAVGDFNRDGKPDLAVDNSAGVSVRLGSGDGKFQAASIHYGALNGRPAAGDFNGDGKLDLAVTDIVSGRQIVPGNLWVFLGNDDGTFQPPVRYLAGVRPGPLLVGDFNGDGKADIAVVNVYSFNIFVLLNTCSSPGINIVRTNSSATISWPFPSAGFFLETSDSLILTNWQAISRSPTTNNGRLEITVQLDQTQRYFRLHQP
jgi:hypothetical protein